MKEWMIVGGMALAVYLLLSGKGGGGGSTAAGTTLVMDFDGWKYYSDGTVIGPDGSYYFKGDQVYQGAQVPAAWNPSPGQGSTAIPAPRDGYIYL